MRTLTKILAGTALAAGLAASASANAAIVTIWVDAHDGNGLLQRATGVDNATFSGSLGGFQINNLSGTAATVSPIFDSQAIDTVNTGPGGDLTIFISSVDNFAPIGNPLNWLTTFTTQGLSAGWTLTEQVWLDAGNQPQVGTLLGASTMNGPFLLPLTNFNYAQVATGSGPYAINTEYVLHAVGAGSANSTINVYDMGGIPEPTTWGLMLVGFGGAGAMLRRRRAVAAAA